MRLAIALAFALAASTACAHEPSRPDLDGWFMGLQSSDAVPCCDGSEATHVIDENWKARAPDCVKATRDTRDGPYCVHLLGKWIIVPAGSVVTSPNKFGPTLVWPVFEDDSNGQHVGVAFIRCFMPGAGA